MLTPEYLQGLPAELEKLYLRLEEETIADISRRIAKVGHISDTAEYQILRMRELGAGTEYIKSKIKEYSGLSDDVVEQLFFDAAQVSDEFYKGAYDKAGKEYKPFEYNDFFQQIVVANVNQTKGELSNLTQSMGFSYRGSNGERRFRPVATAYRECLDYAFTQVETGTTDYITAIRNATRRLTESGLQFVDYDSGVVNHVDVAVRRAVLTGISQVTGKISEHNAAELETDIVEVTAHAGARPDHAEWQGGWYSLSGKSKKYRSLAEATGYGRVDGLKGANCRHDFFPVIEGVDIPLYTKEELANIDPPPFEYNGKRYTYYEATQKQRSMERAIRKTKREILAADKSGDKDRFTEKSIRLRRQREEYEKFSKSAGLLTQNERNQVVGFGRSEASRASWAARSAQTLGNGPKGTPPSGSSAPSSAPSSISTVSLSSGNASGKYSGKFASAGVDKSSGSGIMNNKKDYNTFGLMFVSHRDDLYKYAIDLPPLDGYEDIAFHADRKSFLILDPDTQEIIERVTPQKLAELVLNSSNYKPGTKIRLLSCQSGYGKNSIAKQLADILNVEVIAPTEILAISNDGKTFISDNMFLIDMWSDGEDVQQTGYWKTIRPHEKE